MEDLRHKHLYSNTSKDIDPSLDAVLSSILSGKFNDPDASNNDIFSPLVSSIKEQGDYYLVSDDFNSYITTQELVDEAFADKEYWARRSITSVARMGFFSADRVIAEYAESIWNVEPLEVE